MSELLPDTWNIQEEERGCCSRRTTRRGPVTDILVWLECFAALVAVLSMKYPDKVTHFMTYQRTIIKAQRCFVGDGWVTYDSTYRTASAASKSLDWGLIDFSLYNETFTGRARAIVRCRYCLSKHHDSKECADAPVDENWPFPDRIDLTAMAGNPRRYASCIMTNRRINAGFTPVNLLIGVQVAVGLTLCQCAREEKTVVPITLNGHESKEDSDRTGIIKL